MIQKKSLAIFDFDGTITIKDSLVDFIQYVVGNKKYYIGLVKLSPILVAYIFKLIPNDTAKEKLISYFFASWDAKSFKDIARKYSLEKVDEIVRIEAMKRIDWHKMRGDDVVIVSASIRCWLEAWCDKENIDLICTELEIEDCKLTGKFKTANCHGAEKEKRIRLKYDLTYYDHIYAYGDSSGDHAILSLADYSYYKPFRE